MGIANNLLHMFDSSRGPEYISCVRCARVVNEFTSFLLPYLQCNETITVASMQKATIVYLSCNGSSKVATELPNQ